MTQYAYSCSRFGKLLLWKLLFLSVSFAQNGLQYIYLQSDVYGYINYRVNSGDWGPRFILNQPYELDTDIKWSEGNKAGGYFKKYWQRFYRPGRAVLNLDAAEGAKVDEDEVYNRMRMQGGVHYINEHITLANRTTVDQDYKYDSKFAGDLSESGHWLYGRINEAYISLNVDRFALFLGRIKRNWGALLSPGLILSDNPYSYDHVLFTYTANSWRFSLIYAHLDNVNAWQKMKTDDEPEYVPDVRRYMSGHRLDFRISDRFQFALTEMAMYGGPDRNFEIAFLNPMNLYYPVQRNDRKQMSGSWALDLFYKPFSRWSVYGQFLIDDIIVNNDPGVDDRARYPNRLGFSASIRTADSFVRGLDLELGYTRIWNRTYQSKTTWENYHYRGYGMGYPCASCEEGQFKFSVWQWFPFWISSETTYGRYGSVELTDLFPLAKEEFPVPPVQNNLVTKLKLKYFYSQDLHAFSEITWREHVDHYSNRYSDRSRWIIRCGAELTIDGSIGLD